MFANKYGRRYSSESCADRRDDAGYRRAPTQIGGRAHAPNAAGILQLQQALGNRAVVRMMRAENGEVGHASVMPDDFVVPGATVMRNGRDLSFEAENASHASSPVAWNPFGTSGAPIQRIISKKDGEPYANLKQAAWYRELEADQQAWAHFLHNDAAVTYTIEQAQAEIDRRIRSGEPTPPMPESKKKERRKVPIVPRQTGAAVGTKVDYLTHPKGRTERRFLRMLNDEDRGVGDRNVYVKRLLLPDGRKVKHIAASIPPSSLPPDRAAMPEEDYLNSRLGMTHHSESVTDEFEANHPDFKGKETEELYSFSSREQCESCRYHHPPRNPEAHYFGSYYSGMTDHIEDEDLRNRIIANNGIAEGLKLTDEERKILAEARKDAAAARQGPEQNQKLAADRETLSGAHSDGEHSSDDDDVYVPAELMPKTWTYGGKGNAIPYTRTQIFSQEEKKRLLEDRDQTEEPPSKRRKTETPTTAASAAAKADDADDEREETVLPKAKATGKRKRGKKRE